MKLLLLLHVFNDCVLGVLENVKLIVIIAISPDAFAIAPRSPSVNTRRILLLN